MFRFSNIPNKFWCLRILRPTGYVWFTGEESDYWSVNRDNAICFTQRRLAIQVKENRLSLWSDVELVRFYMCEKSEGTKFAEAN